MTFSSASDDRHEMRERALGRAKAFGRVLFACLSLEETLFPNYYLPIPRSSLPSATALSDALIEAGIETPEELARYLANVDQPAAARGYLIALLVFLNTTLRIRLILVGRDYLRSTGIKLRVNFLPIGLSGQRNIYDRQRVP